ncbi:MAG: aldehyde dehydrogenase family protein [Chloroflexota bacterium]
MTVADRLETMEYGPAPESNIPAESWLDDHGRKFGLFIDGDWHEPASGEYFEIVNPATGKPIAKVAQAGQSDVDAAVQAADRAFGDWAKTAGHIRARYLYALARQLQRHSRLFAVLESLDNGKPIRESRDIDIPLVARHFSYYAGWAQLMDIELPHYSAIGVVGQIIPWNFPLLMLSWKIAPALAAGNTVVLKPAEFTPLTALLFAEVVQRAGLPAGVVNIITGDGRTGELIVQNPDVGKIAFTGSTDVGRIIRRETAGTGKRLSLELGGKSPFVVFDDADLDSVVEGVVDAIWFNQGQVCCAGSRLLVQENVEERLLAKLRARMEKLRVGDSLDKAIDLGAIVAPVQLQKIQRLVKQGVDDGAEMWQPSWACPREGYFFPPTLFSNVSPAATIAQVEIFGPVLVSMTFRTPQEAVALANNTPYGLAASVWSENINLAFDISRQIKAGTVWINSTNLFDASSGFGGYRESGFGREGGLEGFYEYLKLEQSTSPMKPRLKETADNRAASPATADLPSIDRTPKLFIGGRQVRPDSGYSRLIYGANGHVIGEAGEGNRKDIRNAVEAARKAQNAWSSASGHARAQVTYFLAENLEARLEEFAARIREQVGVCDDEARQEVRLSIERLFTYAAWADKFDGDVHQTPFRIITLAMKEPLGVLGVISPNEYPLLGLVSVLAPVMVMGNSSILIPSQENPLSATDLYQVLETSDVPPGVVNIVTGRRDTLSAILAEHDDVEGIWYFGEAAGAADVERASAGNMKRTWTHREPRDWRSLAGEESKEFLRECTQVKNIWTPYGA